jgi:hypothetical protein
MLLRNLLLFSFCFSALVSCNRSISEPEKPKAVSFTVTSRSELFNKKYIELDVDSLDNNLFLRLRIKGDRSLPFPVRGRDTLFKTAFTFNFYDSKGAVQSDFVALRNTLRWKVDSTESVKYLRISTDTIDLRYANDIVIKIPYYAFHNLKKGKQNLRLKVDQNVFTGEMSYKNKDNVTEYSNIYIERSLLSAAISFDLQLPAIYKSYVYGNGLELKNDSTFSPSGMDNTLWKSSYPDLYWSVVYPEYDTYCQTCYETSTDKYVGADTFTFYHYSPQDTVGIAVYDHDNLSRDDGLGFWRGPLSSLQSKAMQRLSFGNVKSFEIKVSTEGIMN